MRLTEGRDPRDPFIDFIRANAKQVLDAHRNDIVKSTSHGQALITLLKAAWNGLTDEQRAAYGGRAIISSSFGSFPFRDLKKCFFIIEVSLLASFLLTKRC
jgi:hypothetical protein